MRITARTVFWMMLMGHGVLWGTDSWPQFGGPQRDFVVPDVNLPDRWPDEGAPVLWRIELGKGYSGIVSDGAALYTLYRDGDDDVVVSLDPADGAVNWTHRYTAPAYEASVTQFGTGPNATPLLIDNTLITAAYNGQIHALNTTDGSVRWRHNLVSDYAAPVLPFGYSSCPIRYKDTVLLPVGGDHGVIAFRIADGEIVWRGEASSISYAPPTLVQVDGLDHLVYFGSDAVFGMDPNNGRIHWTYPVKNQYDNHASAAILGPKNELWVASQMESGSRSLQLARDGDTVQVTGDLWFNPRLKIHYWNAVPHGDWMLAVSGGSVGFLSGIDLSSGDFLWRERGFAPGNILRVGDKWLVLDENGVLHLNRATRQGLQRLDEMPLLVRVARTTPTLVGDVLFARDQKTLVAVDLVP